MTPRRLATRIFASHLLLAVAALLLGVYLTHAPSTRLLVILAAVVLAGALSGALARSLSGSIGRLARSVRHIAGGEPDTSATPSKAELTGLARTLDTAAADLRARVEEVAGERDRARQIVAALESGVLLLDEEGGLRDANPTALAWLGLDRFDAGQPAKRVVGIPEITQLVEQAAASGKPAGTQVTLVFPEHRTLAVRATPLTDRGDSAGALVTLVDLTSRRRLEVLRRDFVANASHELKTPVAAIRVLAESVEDALYDEDPETARRFVAHIGQEAERLGHLVKDLLDLSKVERGTLAVEPVDLVTLATEVIGRHRGQAKEGGIDLCADLQPDVRVRGDRAQLELLVSNLIDNALRYTQRGGRVTLALSAGPHPTPDRDPDPARVPGDPDPPEVTLVVADTGIGIPSTELPRVFERFYRIDKARDRQTGGTGLGLAIVRHVAESHGGKVTVESELGRGSTFTVTLPSRAHAE